MTTDNLLKREILLKEEEKHLLTSIGATNDLLTAIERVLSLYKENPFDKTRFLNLFYKEVIHFQDFLNRQKVTNMKLKQHLSHVSNKYLIRRKGNASSLLDKELKYNKVSIGWFFPSEIFETYYASFCSSKEIFNTPISVNSFFYRLIDKQYPLSVAQYIDLLKNDSVSFWNVTCSYIKDIIHVVTPHVLFDLRQTEQMSLVKDAAWSDTYEILRNKLQEKENPPSFSNGMDFRNYIIKICNFRLQNQRTKLAVKESSLDLHPDLDIESDDGAKEDTLSHSVLDVDIRNPYEVAYAISIILLDKTHPLYQPLTEGIEDKVDVLLRKVVKGQCYNRIVEEMYGICPKSAEFPKIVAKTRKEYERVRKTLQERFIKIKKEQQKMSHLDFLPDNR